MKKMYPSQPTVRGLLLGGVLMGGASAALAQDTNALAQENADLKARVTALEELAQKEGLMPSGTPPAKLVTAISDMTISGFVQASYFANTLGNASGENAGYLWNTKNNNFSINKVKITLASPPAERSDTDWTAGYRVSIMQGQDAPVLNTGSGSGLNLLREAYVEVNVPVGTGLNIKAGQLISLLNWESGDGGAANPNFSQGYQWLYTGDGPETGIQLDYAFTDWLDVKFRIEDGLYGGTEDAGSGKGFMGSINVTPCKSLWFNLIGFGGASGSDTQDVNGGSVIGGYQVTSQLGTGFEFDYFDFLPDNAKSSKLWSLGGWVWYDFTSKVGVAFRAEYLDDQNGDEINGVGPGFLPAGWAIQSDDPNQTKGGLESFTATLNFKPAKNIKIQPEIRYDHTSFANGFNGKSNQLIIGAGVSYLF